MKTVPFIALFLLMIIATSYVSAAIDGPKGKTSVVKKLSANQKKTQATMVLASNNTH